MFKAGIYIGSGIAFILSGTIFVMFGGYVIIKNGCQK